LIDAKPEWVDAEEAGDLKAPSSKLQAPENNQTSNFKLQTSGKLQAPSSNFAAASPRPESDLLLTQAPSKNVYQTGCRVEFEKVSFEYQKDRPVLKDISFIAEPGQSVALVGQTGSGKTTVVALLQKFYLPTTGRVSVDGQDLLRVTSDSLRKQMGSVQQNNFLFAGSVLENIRLAKPEATEADVRKALESLVCLDLLEALPDGLETQVGEKSSALSLGQRQIICFARAFLPNPRIVVLDEATSAIDTVTEARLQRALELLLRGRTAFIIAHRLSTIRKADQALVLDQGKIVERGTHDALLAANGHYARLHEEFVGKH
jgi:ATP-binding cassette subfamily B protein